MTMRMLTVLGFVLTVAALTPSTDAANYSEATQGDLSGDRFAPTEIPLGLGSNKIAGNFGSSPTPGVTDLDYFHLAVPSGQRAQMMLDALDAGG